MSDLSIHVPDIVEEIRVCQGTLPGVGEKAYMCEMVEQHTGSFGLQHKCYADIQKWATLGVVCGGPGT